VPDHGLTHIALTVTDLERSLAFYARFAQMQIVHRRPQSSSSREVAWISDCTRPFAIVLLEVEQVAAPLRPFSHLGVACKDLGEFHALCDVARKEGVLTDGPNDSGPPVGHWAILLDPDGHALELSYGQEVALAVQDAN
jgi:catechol 2,3-dioxygenase-like lactoylglutathione lyase family enzyme